MKRPSFLAKIRTEGKLELVEPNQEIKDAYLKKSESYMISAKILLENDRLEESVSMTYYSMYYLLQALLYQTGIKCENHTAAILLLHDLYGLSNHDLQTAKKERIDKQYYVDFSISKQESIALIKKAESFNAKILDFIGRLQTQQIETLRKKLDNIF